MSFFCSYSTLYFQGLSSTVNSLVSVVTQIQKDQTRVLELLDRMCEDSYGGGYGGENGGVSE